METVKEVRVFVPNYAGHGYEGADKYGRIVSLTQGYVSFESLDRLKYELYKQIVRQTHNEDWLCVSGIQGLATMVAVLWYAHHGQINLLIWDKKKPDEYRELKIDPWHVENMLFEMKKEDAA